MSWVPQAEDLALYDAAREEMLGLRIPLFLQPDGVNERMFVAAFDGTGNDVAQQPDAPTNIAAIARQIEVRDDPRIVVSYLAGPGTQSSARERVRDKLTGSTYGARIDEMYARFARQARAWIEEDPAAKIRLVTIGFSRGAVQAAGFAVLVGERGVTARNGQQLRKPADVPQAIGLFDPVAAGTPQKNDRRLPDTVVSGFQLQSRDEERIDFPLNPILPPGLTENGRFLSVVLPGSHSDVGGGYAGGGLEAQAGDLMIDYLNGLSAVPFLARRSVPLDDASNRPHQEELVPGSGDWRRTKGNRQLDGGRDKNLAPPDMYRDGSLTWWGKPRMQDRRYVYNTGAWPLEGERRNDTKAGLQYRFIDPFRGPPTVAPRRRRGNAVDLLLQSMQKAATLRDENGLVNLFDGERVRLAAFAAWVAASAGMTRIDRMRLEGPTEVLIEQNVDGQGSAGFDFDRAVRTPVEDSNAALQNALDG
ncbi:DUF2235 domain-containing protein [Lysobacter firmicutimachus]|uniref:DUF2235 domain-containing protein n=1 Tax=Lysobacter firmicutimachus TaxID=1792846 RepID=A0AAU8MVM2_9GAMM